MPKKKTNSTVTLKRRLVVKGCERDFGIGPGVLVEDEITYSNVSRTGNLYPLAVQISRDNEAMIKEYVKVELEEVKQGDK